MEQMQQGRTRQQGHGQYYEKHHDGNGHHGHHGHEEHAHHEHEHEHEGHDHGKCAVEGCSRGPSQSPFGSSGGGGQSKRPRDGGDGGIIIDADWEEID